MLYNLDFLEEGRAWPPPSEAERLERYALNRAVFEGEHAEVYREQFRRIERVVGNFEEVVSYPLVVNFQKLMCIKFADLLLGEAPTISAAGAEDVLAKLAAHSNLAGKAYEVAIDVSRYGTGLFLLYRDEDGLGVVDITQPSCWFPVVSPDNIKNVTHHVLAVSYTDGDREYLKAHVHERGKVSTRVYELGGGEIGELVSEEESLTGFEGFAVLPVHNVLTSDRFFGIDDFTDIDSIVAEIEVRLAQISRILDKHSAPTMTGPGSALSDDGNGGLTLKTGNYIVNDAFMDGSSGDVRYITWDAQLDANFKQLEVLVNFLYMLSETGATLLDNNLSGGRAESGTALRLRMMSPLAKVNRIRVNFDPALKAAVSEVLRVGWGQELEPSQVNIIWEDGLPDDPRESAQIMNIRTAGKPTISQRQAIKRLDGVDDALADEIIKEIAAGKALRKGDVYGRAVGTE
ncbi:MAG: phage portal protein [Defluviitaleaceae bacterium]|nr:phage portal protein [Defluviitaleaceae bacterium]